MKKRSAILCAIALVATFACTKETNKIDENNETSLEAVTEVVGANLENDTKATVTTADGIFNWTEAVDYVAFYNGTTYVKSDAAAATGTSTTFTITYTGTRSDYAYFPYYLVQDPSTAVDGESMTTASTTQVALPSTYALTAISGENTPCPMVATNTPGSGWEFHQLCGLFRLTVNSIPSDATGLLVDFHGHKVHGTFDVTGAGTATPSIATAVDNTNDQITVTFAAGTTSATLNLPLPVGDYNDVSITPIGSSTKVSSTRHIKAGGYTAARARGKKLTATLVSFTSGAKKYIFAPGNLQATIGSVNSIAYNTGATPATWYIRVLTPSKWSFAQNQYSYIGSAPYTVGQKIDLFSWVGNSADEDTYGMVYARGSGTSLPAPSDKLDTYFGTTDIENLKTDWGQNIIDSYVPGDWSTPTVELLAGLITSGGKSTVNGVNNARYAKATVAGKKGVIVLPDYYTHPAALSLHQFENLNSSSAAFSGNEFSDSEWAQIEDAGAVFFPLSGVRNGDSYSSGQARYIGSRDAKAGNVWDYIISADAMSITGLGRYYGYAVRLIREIPD